MNARPGLKSSFLRDSSPARTKVAFPSGFVNAIRVHTAVTAGIEKRVLTWKAQRTPAAISPDHLTALGFVCQILAGAAYALSARDGRFLFKNGSADSPPWD